MLLSEILPGQAVQVSAARGLRFMDFSTNVIEVDGLNVKIEPVYQDKKMVGFDIPGIVVSLYVVNKFDNRVYVYQNVRIKSYKTSEGKYFQLVECKKLEGRVTNRRGANRIWLGFDGNVVLGDNSHEHEVIIKDISATGIAFVCDSQTEVAMGMPIELRFVDEVSKKAFKLAATVVRYEDEGNKRIVYGCKFKEESNVISQYVNEKQRQKLIATRTVGK